MTENVRIVEASSVGLDAARLARIRPWMAGYVDSGKLPFAMTLVARRGEVAYFDWVGQRDVEAGLPVEPDTLVRIYSMTKPITSVAMLMLYEEGRYQLDDPVSRFVPGFANLRVFSGGTSEDYTTEPLDQPMTIGQLFTHTSGLTYDFIEETPVSALYQSNRIRHVYGRHDPEEFLARLSELPLLCQPGAEWNYSVSTDVLGCLVEILSGQSFESFLRERVFDPLGMVDTGFHVAADELERFSACYAPGAAAGTLQQADGRLDSRWFASPRTFCSGGGGLVSTARDYFRFAQMLANRGELEGTRLLGRKTVEFMTSNHLPGNRDMAAMGQPRFSETSYEGIGFGLGVSVVVDPAATRTLQSAGTYAWGGMASTAFWVDPAEEMVVVFLTQLQPSSTYPVRNELRVLVNQAVVD